MNVNIKKPFSKDTLELESHLVIMLAMGFMDESGIYTFCQSTIVK